MDNNTQNLSLNKEAIDANFQELTEKKGCKKCGEKKKKGCKMCNKTKSKFGWLIFWSIYLLIFIIWGHIELFKLIKELYYSL